MVEDGGGKIKRVNKDTLREMLDNDKWSPSNEKMVLAIRDAIINKCISKGYDIIVDDTNLHPKMERGIRKLVGNRAEVSIITMNTPLEECLKRNATRTGSDYVPEGFIIDQAKKWESWQHVDCTIEDQFTNKANQDPLLDPCIIVDVDGTLANNTGGRSPYDETRVCEDEVIEEVADLVFIYRKARPNNKIFIFSGRSEQCREDTELWLKTNEVHYDELFMRSTEDAKGRVKDSIVKSKLYDTHIRDKYYVDFVIDDRKQVKEMWNELGLFVLDVNQTDSYF